MTGCVAIIVAAGRGQRFGGDGPKQYQPLAGEPLLARTLRALCTHPRIDHVVPVIHADDEALYAEAVAGVPNTHKLQRPVIGGAARQDSVRHGLEALTGAAPDMVLIHDGARPLVAPGLIDAVIDGLASAEGAIPAVPVL